MKRFFQKVKTLANDFWLYVAKKMRFSQRIECMYGGPENFYRRMESEPSLIEDSTEVEKEEEQKQTQGERDF